MLNLWKQIQEKIDDLNPNEFQIMANNFVRIYRQEVFRGLNELSGLNIDEECVKGQPDSYADYDGGWAALEASKQLKGWYRKSRSDIDRLYEKSTKENIKITYLCFVFRTSEKTKPDEREEIKDYAFKKLGVSQELVELIFGDKLISELALPQYARILKNDLRISLSTNPFKDIKRVIESLELTDFYPKLDDFEEGIVFFPKERIERAESVLNNTRRDLGILGLGTSGKTTFALTLGYNYYKDGYIVLYFDFKEEFDEDTIKLLYETIVQNEDIRLLIILDNVHLYPNMYMLYKEIRDRQKLMIEQKGDSFKIIYVGTKFWLDDEFNFLKIFHKKERGWVENLGAKNQEDRLNSFDIESFYNVYRYFLIKTGGVYINLQITRFENGVGFLVMIYLFFSVHSVTIQKHLL